MTNSQPKLKINMPAHDRTSFESLYTGQPRWDIGRPQKALHDVADQITGAILDSGCSTGEGVGFGPVPAGVFQPLGHELIEGGLDDARADLPALE